MGKKRKNAILVIGMVLSIAFAWFVPFILTTTNAVGETRKIIVLTFDDGPRLKALKELLPILKKYNAPGTFFMMGAEIAANKEFVKDMHNGGYEIENHSWGHENFKKLFNAKEPEAIKNSLMKTDEIIFKTTGRKPRFFRPPFWEINEEVEKIIKAKGYTVMKLDNPDINTLDYEDFARRQPPEILASRVKKIVAARECHGIFNHVLVFHELPLTAKAMETLIPYFQAQGYEFIRLDEKLKI